MSRVFHSESMLTVGNPQVFELYLEDIEQGRPNGNGPFEVSPSSYSATMDIITDVVTDIDLNNDGFNDVITGKAYHVGYGTAADPYRWITFTSVYLGSEGCTYQTDSIPTLPDAPDFIDATIQDTRPPGSRWEESASLMVSGTTSCYHMDSNVASAVHSLTTFGYNSHNYFEFVQRIRKDLAKDAVDLDEAMKNEMPRQLRFTIPAIERVVRRETDRHYRNRLRNIVRVLEANPAPDGRETAYDMWVNPDELSGDQLHDAFYQQLLPTVNMESDPNADAEYLRNRAYFIEQQRASGGLFEEGPNGFVARANAMAVEHGYANYAEMAVRQNYHMSVACYRRTALSILARNRSRIERVVSEMREFLTPGRPVWELNMWRLLEEKMKRALNGVGVEEEPTISVNEAVDIIKTFFGDMGCDLDNLPDGERVVFDLFEREQKDDGGFQSPNGDGSINIIFANYAPDARLNIFDLSQLIHEVGHAVHYIFGSRYSQDSSFGGGDANSTGLRETIAKSFEAVAMRRQFMDRYLAGYSGFENPCVREILVNEYAAQMAYWDSVVVGRALWEANLYEQADRSMDDRLDYWGELGLQYLGYDDTGIPTSRTAKYSLSYFHPVYQPLQYLSYSIGTNLRNRMRDLLVSGIDHGNRALRRTFSRMAWLFEKIDSLFSVADAERFFRGQ